MKKSVLITGSSHGIGAACAVAFAREGYDVGINYLHSPEDAQKVAEQCRELGADAQIYQADVSLHEDCVRMIDAFIEHFGKIQIRKLLPNACSDAFQITFFCRPDFAEVSDLHGRIFDCE